MADSAKDTIYVDVDDEITGIIDKVKASNGKIVALVLPKRASVFQSIVNMKLLKRAADSSKKNLVLITSEAGLLPLAGAAGVFVAKTLTSKPEIPSGPSAFDDSEEAVQEDDSTDAPVEKSKTVGELAGVTGAAAAADGMETLELDNEDKPDDVADKGSKTFEPPTKAKNKKLKVPNFERFRLWLLIGGALLILLIIFFIFANTSLNRATINIKTDATNVNTSLNLNLDTAAKTVDIASSTLPAKADSQQKTYTQQVTTTGQKNTGNKASGTATISLTNCNNNTVSIPAGSGISANGQTYITQSDITLNSVKVGGNCNPQAFAGIWSQSVNVLASQGGASFNIPAGTPMSVASGSDYSSSDVKGTSGNISGGTDSIVQSVNQNDINSAKSKITPDDNTIKQTLTNQLQQEGYYAVTATYNAGTPNITTSANVGDVANSVTVTEAVTYLMFGVKKADLTSLIDNQINSQIDTSKQSILDDGLSKGIYNVNNVSATAAQLTLSTKAVAGPQLDVTTIKKDAAGKRTGDVKSQLGNNPDVTSVTVKFSPFWVNTVPKNVNHITVNIAKPTTTTGSKNGNNH